MITANALFSAVLFAGYGYFAASDVVVAAAITAAGGFLTSTATAILTWRMRRDLTAPRKIVVREEDGPVVLGPDSTIDGRDETREGPL